MTLSNASHLSRGLAGLLFLLLAVFPCWAADRSGAAAKSGEPTDSKAQKTFANAKAWEQHRNPAAAVEDYRKANKQDGGHCAECIRRAYKLATGIGDYKNAEAVVRESLPAAESEAEKATLHYLAAAALQQQGINSKKEQCFSESCEELRFALQLRPDLVLAHFALGVSLAHLHQDDAARAEFTSFLDRDSSSPDLRERAGRYRERIELARARMAPPFSVTTLDGQHISLDSLAGKVVLIDFWATWCGPCREALPHVREIARKFEGQPFVVLSVSMDRDEAKWKDFIAANGMTWMQYRDGYFTGPVSTLFAVKAIPSTFTIDADGVLEDQHVGDASVEGKIKKLIARAVEVANHTPVVADEKSAGKLN